MGNDFRKVMVAVAAAAMLALFVAAYVTRGAMQHLPARQAGGGVAGGIVDQSPWNTVVALAPLAVSAEEQGFAREAARLADHEVDQAFAMQLRLATLQTRTMPPAAQALQAKIEELQATVKQDQAVVDQLTAAAKKAGTDSNAGDDLDVAKAQLGLDSDELNDAVQDLARESGDQRGKIQQELAAHEAAMKKSGEKLVSGDGEIAVISARRYATLAGRLKGWLDQQTRVKLIAQARQEATDDAKRLMAQHAQLEMDTQAAAKTDMSRMQGTAKVKMLQSMSSQRTVLGLLDDRIETEGQLAAVYLRWESQVQMQHRIIEHLLLLSFGWIALIVLASVVMVWVGQAVLEHVSTDKRRLHTLQTIFALGVQGVGLVAVLLVVFGPPSQVSTVLGLATAGLTVVFQDFIIAFCGWFVLMGRHGIRVGDWVEINSVGGEVLEIGLFRTSLLETGNWTSRGHPTGRRVTFMNGFAIHGQYLNFSTTGQWMWDEITLSLPAASDYAKTIDRIRALIEKATEGDVRVAEEEWKRVVRQNSLSQFSAAPTVDVRPAGAGVDLVVRYVTRASDRFELRNKIYQEMVDLLREAEVPAALTDGES